VIGKPAAPRRLVVLIAAGPTVLATVDPEGPELGRGVPEDRALMVNGGETTRTCSRNSAKVDRTQNRTSLTPAAATGSRSTPPRRAKARGPDGESGVVGSGGSRSGEY
jgi:hypothetical protein